MELTVASYPHSASVITALVALTDDEKRDRFFPLKDWAGRHVIDHLRYRKIQIWTPGTYSSGIDLSPKGMNWLRKNWPDDYERMLAVFPTALAQADRWDRLKSRKIGSRYWVCNVRGLESFGSGRRPLHCHGCGACSVK